MKTTDLIARMESWNLNFVGNNKYNKVFGLLVISMSSERILKFKTSLNKRVGRANNFTTITECGVRNATGFQKQDNTHSPSVKQS